MVNGYKYDIFISYSRKEPVYSWVKNHFYNELVNWLGCEMPKPPSIFIDWDMPGGTNLPLKLQEALKKSKYLLAILSPHYFCSPWCLAEWESIKAREPYVGMNVTANPQGLIYPVVFSDGKHFPKEVEHRLYRDLKQWNIPLPNYKASPDYIDFIKEIKYIAKELGSLILQYKYPWQNNWPIINMPLPQQLVPPIPKLGGN